MHRLFFFKKKIETVIDSVNERHIGASDGEASEGGNKHPRATDPGNLLPTLGLLRLGSAAGRTWHLL